VEGRFAVKLDRWEMADLHAGWDIEEKVRLLAGDASMIFGMAGQTALDIEWDWNWNWERWVGGKARPVR